MAIKHYVGKTKPCHEAIVRANFAAKGFESYVPTVREEIRTKTGRSSILVPMFRGYAFVCLDLADPRWREACSARGLVCLLGSTPERPTAVTERAMQWVRDMEASENVKRALGPAAAVTAGDEVIVTMRNGKTVDGVCQMTWNDRVEVLMVFMGEARAVEVSAGSVSRRVA